MPNGRDNEDYDNDGFDPRAPFYQMPNRFPNFPPRRDPDRGPGYGPGGYGPNYPMPPDQDNRPPGPPPRQTPRRSQGQPSLYRIDSGAIRGCRYRYTYIWLENGRSFWAWLTYIGRRSVAGFRWTGYRWAYFGTDLDNISDFECY